MRALTEWLVLLALAVTLFRCFGIEGYLISTGSMAPCLWGYHVRVTCPACRCTFARAASDPFAVAPGNIASPAWRAEAQTVGLSAYLEPIVCPNCSRVFPAGERQPVSEGDQLLVHKDAFAWRAFARRGGPRRWEIAVFRNPEDPRMAYVKRVVGLPGETIELIDGDVYANGRLQRKPLSAQLSTRIPVTLQDWLPDDGDPDWQPRWFAQAGSAWTAEGSRFRFGERPPRGMARTSLANDSADRDWLTYRHWIRAGGAHRTSVPLDHWPPDLTQPNPLLSPLEYDSQQRRLSCTGALPLAELESWEAATDDRELREALRTVYRESHVLPLTDELAYNPDSAAPQHPVRDLMIELTLQWQGGAGTFAIEMSDGSHRFRGEWDFGRGEVRLVVNGETARIGRADLPRGAPLVLLMSTFDGQVLLAQDGVLLCDPFPYERSEEVRAAEEPRGWRVRLGAWGGDGVVDHLGLYRDVHYLSAAERETRRYSMGPDEYFVLGDNSAVSVDSRHWERPGVPLSSFVGKPLIVHLPSRPMRLEWGGSVRQIRVPDLSRIRYIR